MTIEEKAKAYDEALEQAKKYHEEYWQVDAKDITETLFPELRESEDEKIRKEMIKYFTEIKSTVPIGSPNHFDRYIAYLEKQKEQKPAEWSEEDERIKSCIGLALTDVDEQRFKDFKTTLKDCLAWLKSLRPSWKPSEEQMKAFSRYIDYFQARAEAAVGGWNNFDVMIRLYEQLKELWYESTRQDLHTWGIGTRTCITEKGLSFRIHPQGPALGVGEGRTGQMFFRNTSVCYVYECCYW